MITKIAKDNILENIPVKVNKFTLQKDPVSERQREEKRILRARGIRRATEKLEAKTAERVAAEKAKDNHLNTGVTISRVF